MAVTQTTQASGTNFGDIVQRGVAGVQRAQAMEDARREREYQRQLEFEDRYGLPEELLTLEDSGLRTVDDVTTEAMSQARDRYYKVYKELQKDPTNVDLKKRLARIKSTVGTLGMNHQKMVELGQKYVEMLANDQVSGVDEEDIRQMISGYDRGDVKVHFDENDQLEYLFYDENGQLVNRKKYTELARRDITPKMNVDQEVNELVKGLGGFEKDTPDGIYIRTTKGYGVPQIEAANQWIDAQMEDESRMADLLYQATNGEVVKREGFTEEDRNAVTEYLQTAIKGRFTESDTLKPDTAKAARYRVNSQGATGGEKGEIRITAAQDSDGQPLIDQKNNVEFNVSRRTSSGAYEPIEIKTDNSDIFISTIKRDYQGRLVAEGNQRVKMSGTYDSREKAEQAAQAKYGSFLGHVVEDKQSGSYYAVIPYEESDETLINTLGNQLGLGGYTEMRDKLDEVFEAKFNAGYEPFISAPLPQVDNNRPTGTQQQQQPNSVTVTEGSPI